VDEYSVGIMSIHFITGNPGGGKGLLAMQKIIDELTHDERPIITNLPVRIEPWVRRWTRFGKAYWKPEIGLRNYLVKKHGKDFDVSKRVFVIPDTDVPEFYLRRRVGAGLQVLPATRDSSGRIDEYETEQAVMHGGCVYVTDEAWKFWNSRKWQKTGDGLLFYSAQHRHLGDTWFIVTQKTAQVDKALHRVAQDFSVVTNQGKLPLGFFTRPSVFTVSIFDEAPTGSKLEPIKREVFNLDKEGLGACYDTAAGTGIGGGSAADIGERKKGVPWPWALVAALLFILGAWRLPSLIGKAVAAPLRKDKEPAVASVAPLGPVPATGVGSIDRLFSPSGVGPSTNGWSAPVLQVTGAVVLDGVLNVLLSDGRILVPPEVQRFNSSKGALVEGEWIPIRRQVPLGIPPVVDDRGPLEYQTEWRRRAVRVVDSSTGAEFRPGGVHLD